MIITSDRVCESCKYWEQDGEYIGECTFGSCHRFPPTVPIPAETIKDVQLTDHPQTFATDWCGEYESSF